MKVSYCKSFKVKAPWNNLRGRQEIVLSRHPSDLLTSQREGKENENKKDRKDLTASQHFSVSRELTEKSSPGWIWWKVTSAPATKTSAITNITHKSSFKLSLKKQQHENGGWGRESSHQDISLSPHSGLNWPRGGTLTRLLWFSEKNTLDIKVFQKKEKERKTNPALSHLHKKTKLCWWHKKVYERESYLLDLSHFLDTSLRLMETKTSPVKMQLSSIQHTF